MIVFLDSKNQLLLSYFSLKSLWCIYIGKQSSNTSAQSSQYFDYIHTINYDHSQNFPIRVKLLLSIRKHSQTEITETNLCASIEIY